MSNRSLRSLAAALAAIALSRPAPGRKTPSPIPRRPPRRRQSINPEALRLHPRRPRPRRAGPGRQAFGADSCRHRDRAAAAPIGHAATGSTCQDRAAPRRRRSATGRRAARDSTGRVRRGPADSGCAAEAPGPDHHLDQRGDYQERARLLIQDLLQESPGISIKQGNGPRDVGISIRGSNARNGFGIRNIVVLEDGFPVTQPDGLSRTDLTDPHAYGGIDVYRGPSSAMFGNYATGGAINFRLWRGGQINGAIYGIEGGSFGYLNNYALIGKQTGNFEGSLFASDVRGNGYPATARSTPRR